MILIIWGLLVFWTIMIAKKNGRGQVLAGILGFCFGIFAVIGYAIAGKTDIKKAQEIEEYLKIKENL